MFFWIVRQLFERNLNWDSLFKCFPLLKRGNLENQRLREIIEKDLLVDLNGALRFACWEHWELLVKKGANINTLYYATLAFSADSSRRETLLHIYCGQSDLNKERIVELIRLGADLMLPDNKGFLPFHRATPAVMEYFFEIGFDLNTPTVGKNPRSKLTLVCCPHHLELVKKLVDNGAHFLGNDDMRACAYFMIDNIIERPKKPVLMEYIINKFPAIVPFIENEIRKIKDERALIFLTLAMGDYASIKNACKDAMKEVIKETLGWSPDGVKKTEALRIALNY